MVDMSVLPPTQLICVGQARENEFLKRANFGSSVDDVFILLGFIFSVEHTNALTGCRSYLTLSRISERFPEISDAEDGGCISEGDIE
jgi:hypothetical protein